MPTNVPTAVTRKETKMKNLDTNLWYVTTEGDEEGRSTHTIGFFKGKIQDILGHFAEKGIKPFYSFQFKLIEPSFIGLNKTGFTFDVSFPEQNIAKRSDSLKEFLGTDPDVETSTGSYYETVKFTRNTQSEKFSAEKAAKQFIQDLLHQNVLENVKAMGRSSHNFAVIGKNISENVSEIMSVVQDWFSQNHKIVMKYELKVRKYPGSDDFIPCLMIDFQDRW